MREETAVDLQAGSQASHEVEDAGAEPFAYLFAGIDAQPNVVVAPHANRLHSLEEVNRFIDPVARLENVSQDHEAISAVLSQHVDGPSQVLRMLVNVGQ